MTTYGMLTEYHRSKLTEAEVCRTRESRYPWGQTFFGSIIPIRV